MDYIVFDLEWNQGQEEEAGVRGLPFEIIEIGAVRLNHRMEKTGEFHRLIRPQVYHKMNYVTRRLIHMKMEELEEGIPFPEAAEAFLEFCGKDCLFCTWGPLDLSELQRNMAYYGMEPLTDRPLRFFDVQKLFSIAYEDTKSRRSLEYAVDFLQIQKDIPFHRAFGDAYYTARVLQEIKDPAVFTKFSFDTFVTPKNRKEEVHVIFDNYAKYISRVFPDKEALLADREVISTKCYLCHHNLKRKLRWFTLNGRHYYSVSYCERHGLMKAKLRINRTEDGQVFAVKTQKFIGEEELEKLRLRREKAKDAKKHRKHVEQKRKAIQSGRSTEPRTDRSDLKK